MAHALKIHDVESQQVRYARIIRTIERLMQEKSLYREEYDFDHAVEFVTEQLGDWTDDQFFMLSDEELKHRIDQLLAIELAYGMLDDLTPEQMKIFDEAVASRMQIF
jgi:hypothetical protein